MRILRSSRRWCSIPQSRPAQAPDAARIRAAFLQMIARPRVPLAPETQPRIDAGAYRAEQFSFATEAGERVPGMFLKSAAANDRRPVVILLHGTGAGRKNFLRSCGRSPIAGLRRRPSTRGITARASRRSTDPATRNILRRCSTRIAPARDGRICTTPSGT